MSGTENKSTAEERYLATVVAVTDQYTVPINRGSNDYVGVGSRFMLYSLSEEEVKDPVSGRSLGRLEIVKGTGVIINVQSRMSILQSDQWEAPTRRIVRKGPRSFSFGGEEEEVVVPSNRRLEFIDSKVGDKAKPI